MHMLFVCRMSRPPVIRTKAEVQAKLSLLEVCVGFVSMLLMLVIAISSCLFSLVI